MTISEIRERRKARKGSHMPFMKRLRSEVADSMTVFILTAMPFILLCLGWAIDFTKNASVRSDYMDIAQEAAQAAIREQNGNGSLLCGQSNVQEASSNSTPRYVIRGVSNAKKFINDASQGVNGAKPAVPGRAQAVQLAVKSYLEKSGRSTGATSVYRGNDVASANDGHFVRSMRSTVGTKAQQEALDENTVDVQDVATSTDTKYKDTFSITVWCTKGVGDEANRTTTESRNGNKNTVGSGERFNTINMEIHDWSGNWIMGMFNNEWKVQKYTMTPRAVASWSGSAVN